MQINIKGFIVPKLTEKFSDCHDRFSFDKESLRFAISDGVSNSFFPAKWAEILTSNFAKNGWSDTFLEECREEWRIWVIEQVNKPDTKFFTRQMYNRQHSAAATFVGIELVKNEYFVSVIGDSHLFHFEENNNFKDKSSTNTDFSNFPDYWDSHKGKDKGELINENRKIENGDTLILCTDAISKWIIENVDNLENIKEFQNINTQIDFEKFIETHRDDNSLENDDTAVLILNFSEIDIEEIKINEIEITSINDKINEEKELQSLKEVEKKDVEQVEINEIIEEIQPSINEDKPFIQKILDFIRRTPIDKSSKKKILKMLEKELPKILEQYDISKQK